MNNYTPPQKHLKHIQAQLGDTTIMNATTIFASPQKTDIF